MDKEQLIKIIKGIVFIVFILCSCEIIRSILIKKAESTIVEEMVVEAESVMEPESATEPEIDGIEISEEMAEGVAVDVRREKAELTDETAAAIILEIDDAMQDILDSLEDRDGSFTENRDEVRSLIGEYFEESILDYVLFVYQIEEENGVHTHIPYAEYSNYWIKPSGAISILSQGAGWCEVGVVFQHAWSLMRNEEVVPVRLEWQENRWLVTDMSQWYNDFRYYYRPDESFSPEYFTKELAEKLIESLGTDEAGNKVPFTVETDENGYIAAGSSEHLLSEDEISGLSGYQRYFAVQEIYARHGKKFSDPVLYGYFRKKDWYTPYEFVFSEEELSEIETQNVDMLAEKEQFTWGIDIDYGNLYPRMSKQADMLTEEETACMIYHAFDMADEVISFKEENFLEEKSDDVFHIYSLGEYSSEENLKKYLSNWFDESIFDYLVMMYNTWIGLYKGEDEEFTICEGGSYVGWEYRPYFFQKVTVKASDENKIIAEMPFSDTFDYTEENNGEIIFDRIDGRWIITSISQPYYDELYSEIFLKDKESYY